MIDNLHKPIMVDEIISFIHDVKNLSILDCTFGGGGHTKKFLEKDNFVTAIDQDIKAINIASELSKIHKKLSSFRLNFSDIDKIDTNILKNKFNFIFLDLGFSSNQLNDENIGLSFKINSKLNMNYLNSNISAYEIINDYSSEELARVFNDFGEIKNSKKLADYIIKIRSNKLIETNFELVDVLRNSGVNFRSKKIHFATQAFQALRIETNKEIDNLNNFLRKVHLYIQNNGFLAILSFHSLEDRIVKNYFKSNSVNKKNKSFFNGFDWGYEILTKKPLTPSKFEINNNNRSRSAKLRVGRFIN